MSLKKIKNALISVSDKTDITYLCKQLKNFDITIISTGGTSTLLRQYHIPVTDVSDITDFPEMMDGRVKTLHPHIHGGILAQRDNSNHQEAMQQYHIPPIDLVIVNLYPFAQTITKTDHCDTIIENIDIGGPTMIRAAAKNYNDVAIITDNNDYDALLNELSEYDGKTSLKARQMWAQKAFAHTANYDTLIQQWMYSNLLEHRTPMIPTYCQNIKSLRYGENPHQKAWLDIHDNSSPSIIKNGSLLQGKELSYNNINDGDAAFKLISEFHFDHEKYCCAIIKHANPCGVSFGKDPSDAYQKARACDPKSAFGGIVSFNCPIDKNVAILLVETFLELVIAPKIDDDAKIIFTKKPNLRVIETGDLHTHHHMHYEKKSIIGGSLIQETDHGIFTNITQDHIVTKIKPTQQQIDDLLFAWHVCKHVKSNAIIYARQKQIVGIGAGQMSRIDSCHIAAIKSESYLTCNDSVVASDAFFPFADGLLKAVDAGAKAVIQPGGSQNDDKIIEAADKAGIAMVMTHIRHFKH